FQAVRDAEAVIIVNKIDLPQKIDMEEVRRLADGKKVIPVSVKEEKGMEELEEAIASMYFSGEIGMDETAFVTNARHIALLKKALESVEDVLKGIDQKMPIDMIQIDMTKTWETLGEIIGESVQDELLDQLFSQFCLGK
ncbi:MAG: tRNA uridine-5-carboxymethylaminomethyl(34) synthesis GTPase MnmE, partial [Bacillaceae bacterium]|nr:tRNA uridine-5-carboxymethylaminomethyl(34) synthesis GTPase MnmE [Bacillaceae bacterium]